MNTFSERTMMVGYTSSSNCASWCCDKELPCRCAGMSVKRGEQLVDRIHVPALHERGPDRHIGVLQAAADEAVHAIGRIVQRLGGSQQLIECVRELQPFVLEQLFIPVQDPIDKSNQMRTNGDEAVAAARVYQQLLSKYAPPGVTGFNWNESQTTFSQSGAAMWFDGIGFASPLEDPAKSKVKGKVGYGLQPGGPKGRFAATFGDGIGVVRASKKQGPAYLYAQWATNKKNQARMLAAGAASPARASSYSDPEAKASMTVPQE
jgi:hypothetical protein